MDGSYTPLLVRIDDRLIHGQVVVGCCEPLGARRILLVDDRVAGEVLQQKLYRAGVPENFEVEFHGVRSAAARLEALDRAGQLRDLVVVAGRAETLVRLLEFGVRFAAVQLGGAHFHEGAVELAGGVFLDSEDRRALLRLLETGTEIVVQSVARAASRRLGPDELAEAWP